MHADGGLLIVAGEPSGDLHGANLLRALRRLQPELQARGAGGPLLAAAGMRLDHDLASDAVMGLFPVLKALPRLRHVFNALVRSMDTQRPAALLLVDYPGFNLRLAEQARRRGIPVLWYIAPKVWAWAQWRVGRIARCVDQLLVILPFEEEWFRAQGLNAVHVGSPVVDHWKAHPADPAEVQRLRGDAECCVALFPGSRRHVVRSLLPMFLDAAQRFAAAWRAQNPGRGHPRFLVSTATLDGETLVDAARAAGMDIAASAGSALNLMHAADLSLAASGTVNLELALCGKPFVVSYRVSAPFWVAGKLLVKVPHVSPVNLVAGERVVPEHVSVLSSAAACAADLLRLSAGSERAACISALAEVRRKLGPPGTAERAATAVQHWLSAQR